MKTLSTLGNFIWRQAQGPREGQTMIKIRRTLLAACLPLLLGSCSGEDGKDGAVGPAGAQGPTGSTGTAGPAGVDGQQGDSGVPGPQGDPGEPGAGGAGALAEGTLSTGCLSPCHGFSGIVEQWKTSTHFSTYIANLGGDEVDTWTGAKACGNCHAIDGIQQRIAGNFTFLGTTGPADAAHGEIDYANSTNSNKLAEINYGGQALVAEVHCTTCHDVTAANDPHLTGEAYVPGSFPLRAPSSTGDQVLLEKSLVAGTIDGMGAGEYNVGNACIFCHKSRKDVTNYIAAGATNNLSSRTWGPHEGPQADIYTGKGGYHYSGKTYGNSSHQGFTNGCVDCHMSPVDSNQGVGNHSFYPQLATCQQSGCHTSATSFDVGGQQSDIRGSIEELREALDLQGWLTQSTVAPYAQLTPEQKLAKDFKADGVRTGAQSNGLTGDQAGAVYNYFLLARGSAGGVHNPLYVRELIYDSYFAVMGVAPPSMLSSGRP
jgi:hypothetical protein